MEAGRPSRGGRKRTAEAAAPDPTHRPPSRKSRRGDAEADAAASSAPAFSRGGSKERKGDTAGSAEPTQGKRTRSAHAAMVASSAETSAGAVRDSRSVKEGKEAKKEAPGDGGKSEGRAKSRRAEKQAEIAATSSDNLAGASASSGASGNFVASATSASATTSTSATAASAALAMAGSHPGDLFPSSGLRRLLDRGFDELPMAIGMLRGANSRFRSLLDGLKAEGDLARQEGALSELCDMLCMATEETLQGFSMDQFLPPLIALINCEASPEIMLQACRGIAYILEAIPQSTADVVRYGSIPPLCAKLMAIQYIDVAEQALMTLHKISKDQSSHSQLLQSRGVSAVLSYLDFFALSVQRTGMETVSNMCKRVSVDTLHLVVDCIPQLSQMLLHSDSKLVEHVCTAFCRLVSSLGMQKDALEQVAGNSNGVIANVWSLASNCLTDGASGGEKESSQQVAAFGVELCAQLLRMLAMLANASPKLGIDILAQPEVGKVLRSKILIEKAGETSSSENRRRSSMELSSRSSPQLLREIMALTSSLVPALPPFPPKEAKADVPKESKGKGGKASKKARKMAEGPVGVNVGGVDNGEKAKAHWDKNREALEQFGEQVLEAALSMGSLSVDGALRLDALTALCKLVHYMPGDKISKFLPRHQVCELMSALLAAESLQLRFIALVLIHDLMSKGGDDFTSLFKREGIVYAVHQLQGTGSGTSARAKKDEKPTPNAPPWAMMRSTGPAKGGNILQEVNEDVYHEMLAFVCDTHLPAKSSATQDDDGRVTTVVGELRKLGAAMIKAGEQGDEESAEQNLKRIISYFENSSQVSTFEMRCSGVCEHLIQYLSPDCTTSRNCVSDKGKGIAEKALEKGAAKGRARKGAKTEAKVSSSTSTHKASPEILRDRWELFVDLVKQKHTTEEGVVTPAQALVLKLVAALNNTGGFGTSPAPQQGPEAEASWSKQSRLMALPLRLRFERSSTAPDSHKVKDYANPVVIDPLASISAIHDFLWPRVRRLPHEISAASTSAGRSNAGRAEQPCASATAAQERPRRARDGSTGKTAADDSAAAPSGRPKREAAKSSKGKSVQGSVETAGAASSSAGAASSSRSARDHLGADDVGGLRGLVPPWAGPAGLALGAEDEMMSDGEGDLADSMPMDDMVAATLLGSSVDEEGFDHGELDDDMGLDHDGEDEAMLAQRSQVLDIQLSSDAGGRSPQLPSMSAHSSSLGDSSTHERGGTPAGRTARGLGTASAGSRRGARAAVGAEASEVSTAVGNASSRLGAGASGRDESGAIAAAGPGHGPHLRLSIGGKILENHDMSILEAVLMSMDSGSGCSAKSSAAGASSSSTSSTSGARPGSHDPRSALWGSKDRTPIHVIEYAPRTADSNSWKCGEPEKSWTRMGLLQLQHTAPVDQPVHVRAGAILGADSDGAIGVDDLDLPVSTAAMLRLVAVLQSIHADLPPDDPCRVSPGELVVGNLSSKASGMIRDPLNVFMQKLPDWLGILLTTFPFLVAHDVRLAFFDLEAFGLVRALKNAGRNRDGRPDRQQTMGHAQHRQKVRVGRKHIMESAKHIMDIYTQNAEKAGWTLEVEFAGEVGVGKGPTQEFFTFFCRELQQRSLGLWWDTAAPAAANGGPDASEAGADTAQEHVCPLHGLFPAPMDASCCASERKKKIEAFQVMGWVCAKAVHDGRLLDLPFSTPLCHTLLGRPLERADLALVCPDVHKTLHKLEGIVQQKKAIVKDASLSSDAKADAIKLLTYDGVSLDDLAIYFTVPGHDAVVLKRGGQDLLLTVDNVEEYVELLPRVILVDSVSAQLDAFRAGFSRVFPMASLRLFCGDELKELFGSDQGAMDWNAEQLLHVFKFEHGYKSSSSAARLLVQVLAELPIEIKRKFISFCTGCPRLPVGGFAALKPPLTVVKKEPPKEGTQSALDMQLPSVMTCANYLKLPDYASPAVLRDRLLVAVNEADGSFHLS